MGLTNSWAAFQFDKLVLAVGSEAENEAFESRREGKRKKVPVPQDENAYLGKDGLRQLAGGQFKKVKVPESGVW